MTRGLIVAGALVAAANVFVLGGVAYNRSAVVERMELTETEVSTSYVGYGSELTALRFVWIGGDYLVPQFDDAPLRSIGFTLSPYDKKIADTPIEREAFVALSTDPADRQRWLGTYFAHADPNTRPSESRLVAIDIGPDLGALRAKHPDTAHTLVLRGVVSAFPSQTAAGLTEWHGWVSTLLPGTLHLPLELRKTTGAWASPDGTLPRYTATVCVGRRGEAWVESVRPR